MGADLYSFARLDEDRSNSMAQPVFQGCVMANGEEGRTAYPSGTGGCLGATPREVGKTN
jgi:hypothetical protein